MGALRLYCEKCRIFILTSGISCPVCNCTTSAFGAFYGQDSDQEGLPQIFLKASDRPRLRTLAYETCGGNAMVQNFLMNELNRARICDPALLPANTVAMNTRVRFKVSHLPGVEDRYLVYPSDYEPTGNMISIMSPIGAALIGLRKGDRMPLRDLQDQDISVTVESVSAS